MSYTYDQQAIKKEIFDFIYVCAMHDAILQKAFKGEKKWVQKNETPNYIFPLKQKEHTISALFS